MNQRAKGILVIVIALALPIIPFAVVGELPGERWLSATDQNAWLFGLTGFGLLATDVLLPIPSSIVGTLIGARLGFLPGLLAAWSGMMVGNLLGYALGRLLLSRFGERLPQAPTALALFLSRPVPVLAEAVTFTAGAERMPLGRFLALCAAGNLIYAGALTGNGAALIPDSALGLGLLVPMGLPVAGWLAWRWMARRGQRTVAVDRPNRP
jgi:membrane protein DedA with SNARE-associated domain